MKLSISNIAWESDQNEKVYTLLNTYGFNGIEVAPTKVVGDIENYQEKEIKNFLNQTSKYNLKVVAMQSLIYGKPNLKVFSTPKKLLLYLEKVIVIGSKLGAKSLVFGSPKNRIFEGITKEEALKKGKKFFIDLGNIAKKYNINICIEANPEIYGGNFMCNTIETLSFVKEINHQNIKLHLDLGTIIINKENLKIITESIPYITHFHISEPFLDVIKERELHTQVSSLLKNYTGYASIEMKSTNVENIENTLKFISNTYK